MTTPDPANPSLGEPTPPVAGPKRRWYAQPWLLGLAGVVIGVLLGGAVVALVTGDDDEDRSVAIEEGSPTETTTEGEEGGEGAAEGEGATGTGPDRVVIPEACIAVVDGAERALNLLNEGLGALSDLETDRISEALDELDEVRADIADEVAACRGAANEGG